VIRQEPRKRMGPPCSRRRWLDWWVKERPEWSGRVRGPDGRQRLTTPPLRLSTSISSLSTATLPGAGVWLVFALVAAQRPNGVIGLVYVAGLALGVGTVTLCLGLLLSG
jgi:hypothetical protein